MTEREVRMAIICSLWSPWKNVCTFNTSCVTGWESDVLMMTPARYIHEVEIKVSLSDFKADFKKEDKHLSLINGRAIGHPTWNDEEMKFNRDYSHIKPHCISHFWYAVPEELTDKIRSLLPPYAGLIVVSGRRYASKIIPAPKLKNSRKANENEAIQMYRAMYSRAWHNCFAGENPQESMAF